VAAFTSGFDPSKMWHSTAVTPGHWIAVTVGFPEEVVPGSVRVHTGHSQTYHRARAIKVYVRCVCGADCAPSSAAMCALAGGPGSHALEEVGATSGAIGANQLLGVTPRLSKAFVVTMRTPTAAEQPVTPGYLVVRGLRFFDVNGDELFPARSVQN
jgi:hypothetical protein